jgi:diguanylate cyclase (GGDEF)-like protein/PAS domain S-box-containing protein
VEEREVRVLLIDDDEFAFKVVSADLADAKNTRFRVEWRATYDEGLKALLDGGADVCLLDYQLGEHSGLELLAEATRRGCRVPIVLLTAQGADGLDVSAMRAGAADYLVKGEFGAAMVERSLRYAIERAKTLEALRDSEERYALAVVGANDGLWDWKVQSNQAYFSPRWKAIFGFEPKELSDHIDEWYVRIHPDDVPRLRDALMAHLDGRLPTFESEHRILHKDGTYRWVVSRGSAVRGPDGKATRIAGSMRDVTITRGFDSLTGLPNRALYMDCLRRVLERAKRRKSWTFAVLFLDLDRFKVINDSLGHAAGDELLLEVASRLKGCVRSADTVARLGGDEFTLLVEDVEEPSDAIRVAKRVHASLARPISVEGRDVFTTLSVGIAMGDSNYERPEEILRDADTAMYRAKVRRNAHEVFDAKMHAHAVALLHLESELRRAVETKSFETHYQPIVSLTTGAIVGLEALARWKDDRGGLVAPADFVPLAEETGLILEIDRIVLSQAVRQVAEWRKRFPAHPQLGLSVNVSKRHLAQPDFIEHLMRILDHAHLPPHALSLELTETAILESADHAAGVLAQARAREIRVVMDDFGTGYSSLSYLHRLPFSSLKVDRSFVQPLETGETTEIVRAILALASGLGLDVTAEGVESPRQLERLRELGCVSAQGHLFSPATSARLLEGLLSRPVAFDSARPPSGSGARSSATGGASPSG